MGILEKIAEIEAEVNSSVIEGRMARGGISAGLFIG